ncbi:MAG: DUF4360 domain-containing protein [Oligoflexales bacterium]
MKKLGFLLVVLFGVIPMSAFAYDITLEGVSFGGSGCPQTGKKPSVKLLYGRLLFVDFRKDLEATTDGSMINRRKTCQVAVNLKAEAGKTFFVKAVYLPVVTDLSVDASGQVEVATYFQGDEQTSVLAKSFIGPSSEQEYLSLVNKGSEVLKPCDVERSLNVKAVTKVSGEDGQLTIDGPMYLVLNTKSCE